MNTNQDPDHRIAILLRELADVAVVVAAPPPPDALMVAAGGVGRVPRSRLRLRISLGVAAVAVLVVSVVVVARRSSPDTISERGLTIDVGAVEAFPVGSITPVPSVGLYIVSDEREGVLALSTASPTTPVDCPGIIELRDYDREDYGHPVSPVIENAVFVDTCTRLQYDGAGRIVYGPGDSRGMLRLDTEVRDGRIIVRPDLLHPGARMDGLEDDAVVTREGVVDSRSREAAGVVNDVAVALALEDSVLVVVLGAFHDRSAQLVHVPLTVGNAVGELTISDGRDGDPRDVSITWPTERGDAAVASVVADGGVTLTLSIVPTLDPPDPDPRYITEFLERLADAVS